MARFPSKSAQSWKTLKNGCFWHCIVIIEWSRFFPENRAVSRCITYCPLTSDRKLERSYGWKYHNFCPRTDTRTEFLTAGAQLKLRTVTSFRTFSTSVTCRTLLTFFRSRQRTFPVVKNFEYQLKLSIIKIDYTNISTSPQVSHAETIYIFSN